MTEKLYYQDSHLEEFEAQVISCQENQKNNCFEVVLDKTAFFPEGGGQSADSGEINGVLVKDVREKGGQVIHYMAQPLACSRKASKSLAVSILKNDFLKCSSIQGNILYQAWCISALVMIMWDSI